MKKWTAGLALIGLYRLTLMLGLWTAKEFESIAGEATASLLMPVWTFGAWIAFGFLARFYFRAIRWD